MIQLKIVFIALFSTLILKRKYSSRQWISFLLLAIGCSVSQVSMDSVIRDRPQINKNGIIAILFINAISGLAGVICEVLYKQSDVSLSSRNIQLSLPIIMISCVGIPSRIMFEALNLFTSWHWTVIILNSIGGLLVAIIMKLMDNVTKSFALSVSLLFNCILSSWMGWLQLDILFGLSWYV
mmetsp:Transcript_6121/g.21693  ORF Transcript_6121/g.21693 Transcript_6121/m.21693 type:complete len:181 (-) Transcript_6121:125-667(-)